MKVFGSCFDNLNLAVVRIFAATRFVLATKKIAPTQLNPAVSAYFKALTGEIQSQMTVYLNLNFIEQPLFSLLGCLSRFL